MGLQHSYQQQQPNHYPPPAVAHGHPGQHQGAAVPTHAGVHGSQPHAMPQAPPQQQPQMYAPGVHAGLQDAFGGQGAPGGAQYYPGSAPQPHQAPGLAPQPPRHAAGSPLHNEGYMAVLSSLVLRDVNDTVEPDVFDAAGGFSRYVTAHVTVGGTWPADGPHRRAAVKADLTLHASCKLGHNVRSPPAAQGRVVGACLWCGVSQAVCVRALARADRHDGVPRVRRPEASSRSGRRHGCCSSLGERRRW